MDLEKHVCDVALGYCAWRSNRIKDLVLPPFDDMIQLASLLSESMSTKVDILRSKIETER